MLVCRGLATVALLLALAAPAVAVDETEKQLEKYRQMLTDDPWSNPGLLDADRGAALWKEKRGPRKLHSRPVTSARVQAKSRACSPSCRATSKTQTACSTWNCASSGAWRNCRGLRTRIFSSGRIRRRTRRAPSSRRSPPTWPPSRTAPRIHPPARARQGEAGARHRRGVVLPAPGTDGFCLRHLSWRHRQAHSPAGPAVPVQSRGGPQGGRRMAGLSRLPGHR